MRLKIVSEGTTANSMVVNADTGEVLVGVLGVKWECAVTPEGHAALAIATLVLEHVPVDVVGEVA